MFWFQTGGVVVSYSAPTVGEPLACDADETAQHFVKRLEETFIEALGKS